MTDPSPAPEDPRWIAYMAADEVIPALVNPKRHAMSDLRASIRRWGFAEPIVLDERTGRLLSGHGRVEMVATLEGHQARPEDWPVDMAWPPEGITVGEDGRWRMPVTRGLRTVNDTEAHALGVALNRGPERGGWDNAELTSLLDQFAKHDEELLAAAGFTADELTDMLARFGPVPSLDHLDDQHGDHDPSKLWPVLRFKVPPEAFDRFKALTAGWEGGDAEIFGRFLALAEREAAVLAQ